VSPLWARSSTAVDQRHRSHDRLPGLTHAVIADAQKSAIACGAENPDRPAPSFRSDRRCRTACRRAAAPRSRRSLNHVRPRYRQRWTQLRSQSGRRREGYLKT
jgi:hypothetical protein